MTRNKPNPDKSSDSTTSIRLSESFRDRLYKIKDEKRFNNLAEAGDFLMEKLLIRIGNEPPCWLEAKTLADGYDRLGMSEMAEIVGCVSDIGGLLEDADKETRAKVMNKVYEAYSIAQGTVKATGIQR